MLGFKCANCGQLELAHLDDFEGYLREGGRFHALPDLEYGEEIHVSEINDLADHKPGYRYHLIACPGFELPKNVSREKIIQRAMDNPTTAQYLEGDLKTEVEEAFQKAETKKIGSYSYGGGATYITYNPNTGESQILFGE